VIKDILKIEKNLQIIIYSSWIGGLIWCMFPI
jgi:hypothetical protein